MKARIILRTIVYVFLISFICLSGTMLTEKNWMSGTVFGLLAAGLFYAEVRMVRATTPK